MDRVKGIGAAVRKLCIGAAAMAAVGLLVVTGMPAQPDPVPVARAPAWGSEALSAVGERAFELAPFSVANACGIGASSCFKCHNGARAEAPKMDKKAAPWHPDHKSVNDSCVGCHGGNARIIKKEIAHANIAKDPRTGPAACEKCHKSGDAPNLLKSYQVASAGGK